mmetsp:Transcript_45780/g.111619  ORF Transcript_45780/g.111619 Transcript_45780/m.111619 type:complete len:298 (+) Transcript_45780:113-1006(+)|eukprot:CAMPEP_0113503084 /NCGR_PEP_ID=MMETSP0014_2-20120614/33942_1 /TAXON_ID=2857 /ORGANISM="Nitzschia sp." /LENGTH=297 /DNA_ID=CAMNT_0000398001 /DNA_START=83 /DNA_END=976 /DNA_ORIENTATION=+ /assembly_acc=CAM_ASM_000159
MRCQSLKQLSPLVFSLATAVYVSPIYSSLVSTTRRSTFVAAASAAAAGFSENSENASATTTTTTSAFVSPTGATRSTTTSTTAASATSLSMMVDPQYPGTAVERMMAVRDRATSLTTEELSGPWEDVRRKILWAGGLRDLPTAIPGQGYTGHSFNDYNHVDLTCMREQVSRNENDGSVQQIAIGNQLGPGIKIASLEELGPGGSWSTCAIGCNQDPPRDVAHIQFKSRIAFKLVWCPTPPFDTFVLVDDGGKLLAQGTPQGSLPSIRERQINYKIVAGSKYAEAADEIAKAAIVATS